MTGAPSGYRRTVVDQQRARAHPDGDAARPSARSTTADIDRTGRVRAGGVWLRRTFIVLLVIAVALGLVGFWGVRARTVRAATPDGQVRLSVRYAQVARAGLAVPFEITVHRAGGFTEPVTIAVSSNYLDLFDQSGVDPNPSSSTSTESTVIWQFAQPPGDTLTVSVDMQVQSSRHWGRSGTVALLDDDGQPLITVAFKTWLAP